MTSRMWKQVDFTSRIGDLAVCVLEEVAPEFCFEANADLLDCLRTSIRFGIESACLMQAFNDFVIRQLNVHAVEKYNKAMTEKFSRSEYPDAVKVVKLWQVGLYKEQKRKENQGPLIMPSPRWINMFQEILNVAIPPDPVLTNPDSAKKLAEIIPNLRSDLIPGLYGIIDKLVESVASYHLANIRVADYFSHVVSVDKIETFQRAMATFGCENQNHGQEIPRMFATILSVQYPLCVSALFKERVGFTPILGNPFLYEPYFY